MTNNQNDKLSDLYHEMYDLMVNYANLTLRNIHSAQDAVNEAFLAAQENVGRLMNSENPRGWLMKALKFKVLDELLWLSNTIPVDPTEESNSLDIPVYDKLNDLGIHEMLMKREYKVLRLVYIEGYSVKETAIALGIKYDACLKRIHEAKRKLAQKLL